MRDYASSYSPRILVNSCDTPTPPYQDPLFPHGVLLLISFRGTTPPLSEFLRIDWISRDLRVGRDGCAGILLFLLFFCHMYFFSSYFFFIRTSLCGMYFFSSLLLLLLLLLSALSYHYVVHISYLCSYIYCSLCSICYSVLYYSIVSLLHLALLFTPLFSSPLPLVFLSLSQDYFALFSKSVILPSVSSVVHELYTY